MDAGILLAEDHALAGPALASFLHLAGYRVAYAATFDDAILGLEQSPHICILDYRLPGGSGVDLTREARRRLPDCFIAVVSGEPGEDWRDAARAAGANLLMSKPLDPAELLGKLPAPRGVETLP